MSFQITSKIEINLLNTKTSSQHASQFAIKQKIPAIVASPEYIAPLAAHRAVMNGGYKLICALDFPKGSNFAMDKLFRANPDFIAADGFDILLSSGRSEVELRNEMKSIYEYLKNNRPLCDIRWCLNMHRSTSEVEGILKNMKKFPPSFVRVDPHLDIPNVDIDKLKKHVDFIKEHVPFPIKLSGNIALETLEAFKDNPAVKRFDVSMQQADQIIYNLKLSSQPKQDNKAKQDDESKMPDNKGPAVKKIGPRINI